MPSWEDIRDTVLDYTDINPVTAVTSRTLRNYFDPDDEQQQGGGQIDAASQVPKLPGLLAPPPGGVAGTPEGVPTDPEAKRVAELMAWYGIDATTARKKVFDGGRQRLFGDVLTDMHRYDPTQVQQLQKRLYRGGFFGQKRIGQAVTGRWDADTVNAAVRMFEEASRVTAANPDDRRSWDEVLAAAEQSGGGGAGEGPGRQPSGYGAAQEQLRGAMKALLGRDPNAREVRRFKRRLNNAERSIEDPGEDFPLKQFGLSPDDVEDDDDGFREGDAGLLAETEVLGNNGVEHAQYQSGKYASLFENMMVGR